ncbi:hypothetical protein [Sphingopyxis flava]|uniref:hypothetical protein n=1 Tax=Sphingopyxis flava TaxID=1507287 RepID=UPI0009A7BCEB|nr:hypothetical protein [Sphingopyxis flava]
MQLVAQEYCQLLDLGGCDHRLGHREAAGQFRNLFGEFITPEPEIDQSLAHGCVLGIHQPFFDQFEQSGDACFSFLVVLAHLPQPAELFLHPFARHMLLDVDECRCLLILVAHLPDLHA